MRSAPGPIACPPAFNATTASSFSCWDGFACKNGGWLWGTLGIIMALLILRLMGLNIMKHDGHDWLWIWPFLMWPSMMWVYTLARVVKSLNTRHLIEEVKVTYSNLSYGNGDAKECCMLHSQFMMSVNAPHSWEALQDPFRPPHPLFPENSVSIPHPRSNSNTQQRVFPSPRALYKHISIYGSHLQDETYLFVWLQDWFTCACFPTACLHSSQIKSECHCSDTWQWVNGRGQTVQESHLWGVLLLRWCSVVTSRYQESNHCVYTSDSH